MKLASKFVAAVALLFGTALRAQNVDDIAHAVDDHYNHLKTFKSAFVEVYQASGVTRTESGSLWLKKPGKMRWEYRQPKEKLFLVDPQSAYFYVIGEPQARKMSVKDLDDVRSPLRYLLGKTKLQKELAGLSLAPDHPPLRQGDMVLRGVPKGMKERISQVLLEISPSHQIDRIVIDGVDGTSTDFRFSEIEEGIPVQDTLFRFSPPPGVVTIETTQVAQ